jgi:hypothetical protein
LLAGMARRRGYTMFTVSGFDPVFELTIGDYS